MATVLKRLRDQGVIIPWPDQVAIADDVNPGCIEAGVVLHPGTRLEGDRLLLGAGTEIGTEGPARVKNCAFGRGVKIASGSYEGAVFLDGASHGPNGHVRAGTLFEEGANAAHAVGTKQTILLAWATLGSNINFCDALLSGGTSSSDHSEVGSGFIHFNFTPHGPKGDKATPSLFGGVPRGVLGREKRIFLGGSAGVVGPIHIGFGTVLAAGGVYRKDRDEDRLVFAETLPSREVAFDRRRQRRARARLEKNLLYVGHLEALRLWYAHVRQPLAMGDLFQVGMLEAADRLFVVARRERSKQIKRFLGGLSESLEVFEAEGAGDSPEAVEQRQLLQNADAIATAVVHPTKPSPDVIHALSAMREALQADGAEPGTPLTARAASVDEEVRSATATALEVFVSATQARILEAAS